VGTRPGGVACGDVGGRPGWHGAGRDRAGGGGAGAVGAFSARLRDQVDLDDLRGELLAVVDQTMQPTRASLWLRPPPA
jgi:hypothetical protein